MVRYAFDLYPRTDPRDGALVRRFEHLQEASYRAEENGTGSGQIKVAGDSPDGEDIDPRGLQYIRVVEIDDSDVETVKGGFWLEQGQYQALTRRETKHLEFGGAGTLAYLQRAVMWSRTYIHDVFTGQDPIGTTWNLAGQSTYYANGNHLGAMLWRAIYEAQHFQSGAYTHRHFDFEETGITHTGTHDDDRTESAIPDLVMTFDQNEDSDGNPWTLTAGTFTAQVGESVLSVTRRLMELGLKVEMDPDTFELNAWEAPHRTDRTSTSWASGKVLFTAPTAQDIATGNILSDTIRTIRAFIKRSIVLAGSDNVYAISEGATDIPWEGGYRFDVDDAGTAEDVASRQRLARADSVDNVKVVMKLGNAPLEGRYRPWVHVNPGDLVTLDTGTDQWEFDNTTFPVAALTVELKKGSDWRAIAELGSSFTSLLEPAFQVGGAPAHTHPPNPQLCQVPQPSTESTTRLYFSNSVHAHNVAGDAAWDNLQSGTARTLKTTRDESYMGAHSLTDSQGGEGRDIQKWIGLYGPLSSAEAAILAAGGSTISGQLRARMRFGIGISDGLQSGFTLVGVRVTQGASTTIRGTAAAVGSLGATEITGQSTRHNRQVGPVTLSAVGGTAAGDFMAVEVGYRNETPEGEASGSAFALTCDDALDDLPSGNDNTGAVLNSYLDWVTISGEGSTGDLPLDTVHQGFEKVGSASRAARCDHQHAHGLLSEDGTEYHDFGVIDLSDDTPLVESGSGDPGTAEEASRADHVHPESGGSLADHNHTTAGGDGGDLDGARIGDFLEFTEAAAPSTPATGFARLYAKSDGRIYSMDEGGTEYGPFDAAGPGGGTPAVVSGGTETDDGTHQWNAFTSNGTLTVSSGGLADVLIVGAGGGGGGYFSGGGGGAGDVILLKQITLEAGSYSVTIGAGGAGATGTTAGASDHTQHGSPGAPSKFGSIAAAGGGPGMPEINAYLGNVNAGASYFGGGSAGGGGGRNAIPGGFVIGGGNTGGASRTGNTAGTGAGGGGGGAGTAGAQGTTGNVGGAGGDGVTVTEFSAFGASGVFGGGGGGGGVTTGGAGGSGGGGHGGGTSANTGITAGTANTGGGGGGSGNTSTTGAVGQAGGSGVVIVRTEL